MERKTAPCQILSKLTDSSKNKIKKLLENVDNNVYSEIFLYLLYPFSISRKILKVNANEFVLKSSSIVLTLLSNNEIEEVNHEKNRKIIIDIQKIIDTPKERPKGIPTKVDSSEIKEKHESQSKISVPVFLYSTICSQESNIENIIVDTTPRSLFSLNFDHYSNSIDLAMDTLIEFGLDKNIQMTNVHNIDGFISNIIYRIRKIIKLLISIEKSNAKDVIQIFKKEIGYFTKSDNEYPSDEVKKYSKLKTITDFIIFGLTDYFKTTSNKINGNIIKVICEIGKKIPKKILTWKYLEDFFNKIFRQIIESDKPLEIIEKSIGLIDQVLDVFVSFENIFDFINIVSTIDYLKGNTIVWTTQPKLFEYVNIYLNIIGTKTGIESKNGLTKISTLSS